MYRSSTTRSRPPRVSARFRNLCVLTGLLPFLLWGAAGCQGLQERVSREPEPRTKWIPAPVEEVRPAAVSYLLEHGFRERRSRGRAEETVLTGPIRPDAGRDFHRQTEIRLRFREAGEETEVAVQVFEVEESTSPGRTPLATRRPLRQSVWPGLLFEALEAFDP